MCDQLLTHDKLSEITRLVDEFLNISRERDALAGDGKLKIELQLADWGTPAAPSILRYAGFPPRLFGAKMSTRSLFAGRSSIISRSSACSQHSASA